MGGQQSFIPEKKLSDYENLTYLTRSQILKCFKTFKEAGNNSSKIDYKSSLPGKYVSNLPDLKYNPLKDQIIKVFSTTDDKKSFFFEDYLNMMSVFSESAPITVKCFYAFKIYDFDDDGVLSEDDVDELIDRLTVSIRDASGDGESGGKINEPKLNDDEKQKLKEKLFGEADIDDDNVISLDEFQFIINKSADFQSLFSISI